jgi:hypothetical protein
MFFYTRLIETYFFGVFYCGVYCGIYCGVYCGIYCGIYRGVYRGVCRVFFLWIPSSTSSTKFYFYAV